MNSIRVAVQVASTRIFFQTNSTLMFNTRRFNSFWHYCLIIKTRLLSTLVLLIKQVLSHCEKGARYVYTTTAFNDECCVTNHARVGARLKMILQIAPKRSNPATNIVGMKLNVMLIISR
jgi:hypothetical protein